MSDPGATRELFGHRLALHPRGPVGGPAVLFLHSSGLSGRQWRRYALALAEQGWRAFAPDYIGCGDSEGWHGEGPFHFHADRSAMAELARELDEPLALVGHSYGGLLALQIAVELGERVTSIAVWEPVAWGVLRDRPADAEPARALAAEFYDPRARGTEGWMRRFVEWWSGEGAWEALGEGGRARMMDGAAKTFDEVRSVDADRTPASYYASIEAPVLLMNGTRSPSPARSACERLAHALPHATRTQLEGAGHLAPLQEGERVAPLVLDWLAKHRP